MVSSEAQWAGQLKWVELHLVSAPALGDVPELVGQEGQLAVSKAQGKVVLAAEAVAVEEGDLSPTSPEAVVLVVPGPDGTEVEGGALASGGHWEVLNEGDILHPLRGGQMVQGGNPPVCQNHQVVCGGNVTSVIE